MQFEKLTIKRHYTAMKYILLILMLLATSCASYDSGDSYTEIQNDEELEKIIVKVHDEGYDLTACRAIWGYYLRNARYEDLRSFAEEVCSSASSPETVAYASYYAALSSTFLEDYDKAEHYFEISFKTVKDNNIDDDILNGKLNETAGIFILKKSSNYAKALNYFTESYKHFESVGDSENICINLLNITEMSLLRNDTSGLGYALKAYKISRGTVYECAAASKLALMYSMTGQKTEALEYAHDSVSKLRKTETPESMYTYIYMAYAEILTDSGDTGNAEIYFKEAEKYLSRSDVRTRIRFYVAYAKCKNIEGNYANAIRIYSKAENIANQYSNREFNHSIYIGTASSYEAIGDSSKAMEYYKRYTSAYHDIINFSKEQELQSLKLKYEQENFRLRIDKEKNKSIFLLTTVLIITCASIYVFLLYRKQHILYKNIVSLYNDYRKEIEKIKEVEELKKNTQMKSMSGMYERLEKLMKEDKLYRRSDITLQNISEQLGSNTAYVSNMINQFSGKTFPNYINSYRIHEVVEALSSKDSTASVKDIFTGAGFYSVATAYRVFQKEVGCTPNKFREQMQKTH